MLTRRSFMAAILSTAVAPAIVRAASLMPVRALPSGIVVPTTPALATPSRKWFGPAAGKLWIANPSGLPSLGDEIFAGEMFIGYVTSFAINVDGPITMTVQDANIAERRIKIAKR